MQSTANIQLNNKIKWAYSGLVIIIIWFSLVLQFSLSIPVFLNKGRTLAGALVELFSYFTILTNLLVVIGLTTFLLTPKGRLTLFFNRPVVLTAMAVYITIVGLIYNLILRNIWNPEGLFKLADELLHVVNPLLFIIYWLAFVPKEELKYRHTWPWLWYPAIYFVYALIRGALSGFYPYPFLDVSKSGYAQVFLNALILLPAMWCMCALFVFIGRQAGKRSN